MHFSFKYSENSQATSPQFKQPPRTDKDLSNQVNYKRYWPLEQPLFYTKHSSVFPMVTVPERMHCMTYQRKLNFIGLIRVSNFRTTVLVIRKGNPPPHPKLSKKNHAHLTVIQIYAHLTRLKDFCISQNTGHYVSLS